MKKNKVALKGVLIVLLLVLVGISSFFGYYFYGMRGVDLALGSLNINESSNINYNVKYKDPSYYKNNDSNEYVTSFIDDINAYFNYTVSFSNKVKGEYSYYIIGKMETSVKSSAEVLLNKDLYKTDVKKFQIDGNVINLSSSFVMDLDEYKKIYDDFLKKYDLDLLSDVSFDVIINYKVHDEVIDKDVKGSKTLNISAPIDQDILRVKTSKKETNQRHEYSDVTNNYDSIYFFISLEFFGTVILFILIIALIIKSMIITETDYEYDLRKILKKYDSLIVRIKSLPDLSETDVLFVHSFKDLVDASNNLALPINYVEVVKGRESAFIITNDKQTYVYKLNDKNK